LASGHRISTVFNGQVHVFKMARSKVFAEYYNSHVTINYRSVENTYYCLLVLTPLPIPARIA
jgi:hypothetical protein